MSWKVSVLLLVALQPLHGSAQCEPDCTIATVDNDKVPDPLDCHNFYVCVGTPPDLEALGPLDCPDGEYFFTGLNTCMANLPEDCVPACSSGNFGTCTYFDCGGATTIKLADRFDCRSYYECFDPEFEVHTCNDEEPFFNGYKCQTDERACCHCRPYCYADDVDKKVVDPLDCTRYYLCTEANVVPEYHGSCDSGEHFNFLESECSSTAPCVTLCTNVIQPDGCIDVFTCENVGAYAACAKGCDPRYYHCYDTDIGNVITATTCPDDKVYHPDNHLCVTLDECPYKTSRH